MIGAVELKRGDTYHVVKVREFVITPKTGKPVHFKTFETDLELTGQELQNVLDSIAHFYPKYHVLRPETCQAFMLDINLPNPERPAKMLGPLPTHISIGP